MIQRPATRRAVGSDLTNRAGGPTRTGVHPDRATAPGRRRVSVSRNRRRSRPEGVRDGDLTADARRAIAGAPSRRSRRPPDASRGPTATYILPPELPPRPL